MCPRKGLVTSSRGLPRRYPGVDDYYLSGKWHARRHWLGQYALRYTAGRSLFAGGGVERRGIFFILVHIACHVAALNAAAIAPISHRSPYAPRCNCQRAVTLTMERRASSSTRSRTAGAWASRSSFTFSSRRSSCSSSTRACPILALRPTSTGSAVCASSRSSLRRYCVEAWSSLRPSVSS